VEQNGDPHGKEKNEDNGALELGEEKRQVIRPLLGLKKIGAITGKALLSLFFG
jgi:hypothetical protein